MRKCAKRAPTRNLRTEVDTGLATKEHTGDAE